MLRGLLGAAAAQEVDKFAKVRLAQILLLLLGLVALCMRLWFVRSEQAVYGAMAAGSVQPRACAAACESLGICAAA